MENDGHRHNSSGITPEKVKLMEDAVKTILDCLGEDTSRPGLLKTPSRVAKALQFFTSGYQQSLKGKL